MDIRAVRLGMTLWWTILPLIREQFGLFIGSQPILPSFGDLPKSFFQPFIYRPPELLFDEILT